MPNGEQISFQNDIMLYLNIYYEFFFLLMWLWLSFLTFTSSVNLISFAIELIGLKREKPTLQWIKQLLRKDDDESDDEMKKCRKQGLMTDGLYALRLIEIHIGRRVDSLLTVRNKDESEVSRRMKTEFMVQLCGAASSADERILIIGATNRPYELDDAVLK